MLKKTLVVLCVLLVTAITRYSCVGANGPVVNTPLGTVMGTLMQSYEGRTFAAFEGIPYAKAPVGELRFKEPQPADSWSEVLVANKTFTCLQYTFIAPTNITTGEEDCLYINVYVPREFIVGDENLPVVVHIHGGGFLIGNPASLAGPQFIMDRNIIFVSITYRLGLLGFLSTEDHVVPGNNGLKDQALAMNWIKENIRYFGGNSDSITLTGWSAGAASVHFHYLSPLSKGLFHRGFSQSGTALNPWALTKNPLKNAKKLGEIFACPMESSLNMVDCLRKVPGKNLVTATGEFFVFSNAVPINIFAPVVERGNSGAFLPDLPYKLLTKGNFNDCPWITSTTKHEGIFPVGFFVLFRKLAEFESRWNELLPFNSIYYDTADESDQKIITDKIREHYMKNSSLSIDNIFDFIKLNTDRFFLVDSEKAVRLQAKMSKSPVYYYHFDYLIDIPISFKANLPGAAHGDDSNMLYHQLDSPMALSDSDHKMKDDFIDFLYNFASTSKPSFASVEWEPVVPHQEQLNYLHISSPDEIRMENTKCLGDMPFWNSLPLKENEHLI